MSRQLEGGPGTRPCGDLRATVTFAEGLRLWRACVPGPEGPTFLSRSGSWRKVNSGVPGPPRLWTGVWQREAQELEDQDARGCLRACPAVPPRPRWPSGSACLTVPGSEACTGKPRPQHVFLQPFPSGFCRNSFLHTGLARDTGVPCVETMAAFSPGNSVGLPGSSARQDLLCARLHPAAASPAPGPSGESGPGMGSRPLPLRSRLVRAPAPDTPGGCPRSPGARQDAAPPLSWALSLSLSLQVETPRTNPKQPPGEGEREGLGNRGDVEAAAAPEALTSLRLFALPRLSANFSLFLVLPEGCPQLRLNASGKASAAVPRQPRLYGTVSATSPCFTVCGTVVPVRSCGGFSWFHS